MWCYILCNHLYVQSYECRRLGDRFLEHPRDVERNDVDASKPVAKQFNLPTYSIQHMAASGLSLHLGSSESRKTLEQKFIFFTSASHSTNLFLFSRHHIPTNNVAPLSTYKPTHNPQLLQSLWRRANARNVSLYTLHGGQFTFSTQLSTLNYPYIYINVGVESTSA